MKIQDKAVLITGAGRGIGAAMALRFAAESPRGVVVSDIDEIGAQRVARRGEGYLLITASAAGLLGIPGDAPYSVTKHAAVGLAEWLAFTYGPTGVRVSALCPLGVRTELLMPGIRSGHPAARAVTSAA